MPRSAPFLLLFSLVAGAGAAEVARSARLPADQPLNADPESALWQRAPAVATGSGPQRQPVPGHRTEIRSRWTSTHLYFLFICPYETLHLNPSPSTASETNKLWERDVAEVFIGADFEKIWQYREYQVSPQGEWVDLDIDTREPKPEGGWRWNSGFEVKARVDGKNKVWYGAMKIPVSSITRAPVQAGSEFRANFYRIQGPPPDRRFISWQPTGKPNYHVPEAFGLLRLEE